jgi:hypothetical protein
MTATISKSLVPLLKYHTHSAADLVVALKGIGLDYVDRSEGTTLKLLHESRWNDGSLRSEHWFVVYRFAEDMFWVQCSGEEQQALGDSEFIFKDLPPGCVALDAWRHNSRRQRPSPLWIDSY